MCMDEGDTVSEPGLDQQHPLKLKKTKGRRRCTTHPSASATSRLLSHWRSTPAPRSPLDSSSWSSLIRYDGSAAAVWEGVRDGKELVARIGQLPGFGEQKAEIFAALLGKQFGVQPSGWRAAAGDYGTEGSLRSVADVVDADSLKQVRAFKKQMKAAAKAGK